MLRAVHSNRAEQLLGALIDALPPVDPFAPATIVVGSHLVARWLSHELAFARGIAAGIELVTFDAFVERTWCGDDAARAAGLCSLDRRRLVTAFASVLADDALVHELPAVAAYLAAAPAPGDRAAPRRVQLAEQLAELTWTYALTRPDWMSAFVAGQLPAELADDATARWQASLIAAALARPRGANAVPTPMLPWARRRAGLPPPASATPIAVFGMSFLARAQLEALTDLSATSDVTVYVLDPCEELWDDVIGRGRAAAAGEVADPLPLILWGRPVRDTLAALVERTDGDLDACFADGERESARARLLADVRTRAAPSGEPSRDAGVSVLACPNPRREIEVIAAEVRRRLDGDSSLRAHEIAVWVAGEAERYLALAPAAFDAVGVPCHLIDAPIDDRGRIGEAMLALLELPTGTLSRSKLLRVMTHPAVLAAHPHVDAADWIAWTEKLGIVHGADESDHRGTYLEDHPAHFHWDQGVRRLVLGAFMVGERAERGAASVGGAPCLPEELRPDQQASAATFALLVRSLTADGKWLATHDATLAAWADIFAALVDTYLAPRDEEAKRDIERVRAMLAGLAQLDIDDRRVGFREAREHAMRRLGHARADRGEPLAAGVMIAPLAAMRGVPFRITFVAGLAEGEFPASDRPSSLDVRRTQRPGDVSPRDRDRAAFLEVLLCAREALYLSYVAVEPKSGQPVGPSSVVLELADALAPYLGAAAGTVTSGAEALAALTTRHPLHRFGGAQPSAFPAVARERWACAVRDALREHVRAAGHPVPDEDGVLRLLAAPEQAALRAALGIEAAPATAPAATAGARPLSISNLRTFLEYPVQAWAQAVLGLDELPDDEVLDHSDEPFHQARPVRAGLLRDVLAAHLRDPSSELEALYAAQVALRQLRGEFPVGVFAEAARDVDLELLRTWRAGVGPIAVGTATRFAFGRASSPNVELLPALAIELADGRSVRLVGQTELLVGSARRTSLIAALGELDKKSAYHLRGALDHVVLAAAGLAPEGHVHKLLAADGKVQTIEHAPWSAADARAYLAALAGELLDRPHGYLLPFDALIKAGNGETPTLKTRSHGETAPGLGFGPIQRRDGLDLPADARAIAERRWLPLLSRMSGHSFTKEGAR